MFVAKVTGSLVATQKVASMVGYKLLVVEPYRLEPHDRRGLQTTGRTFVAVDTLGANRIGHGCAAATDPELLRRLARDRILVECCLSSNEHTGAVKRGMRHPIHAFLEAGVPVAICCDNTTVSRTNQALESARAAEAIGLEAVEHIHRHADEYSFIRPETALAEEDD